MVARAASAARVAAAARVGAAASMVGSPVAAVEKEVVAVGRVALVARAGLKVVRAAWAPDKCYESNTEGDQFGTSKNIYIINKIHSV